MATQTQTLTPTESERARTGKEKIQQLRELFADAPELGRKALDNVLHELTAQATPPLPMESAGRAGVRLGKVSELTIVVPLAPGGAKRLRAFLQMIGGNLSSGTSSTPRGKAGQAFAARRRKTISRNTRSRRKAGSSPIRI
jgi:hypothetical protein